MSQAEVLALLNETATSTSCTTVLIRTQDEEIPLARLASGTGEASAAGHDTPGQSKATLATPASPQRQLRQTRSQTRHSDVGSVDQPNAKASQAAEVSHDNGDEDVDILALSSPSSAGEVDITGSPAVAVTALLHSALHPDELLLDDQLQAPPDPSLGVGIEVGAPKGASLPEQFAAMETDSAAAAANDDEDIDIEGDATTAAEAEDHPEQPASSATAAETAEAATPAAAQASEGAEAVRLAPAKASKTADAVMPAPAKATEGADAVTPAPVKAVEHEQPPSRGRGSRGGRRGGRAGRGRGRSKPRGRARAAPNSSPRAPSEQDQAEFADQLDQSPSHAEADSGDTQAEQSDDKDVSISDVTDQPKQPQKRSSVRKGKSDASQASDQLTSARSRASKEPSVSGSAAPDSAKRPVMQSSTAPEAEEAAKEPKSAAADVKVQKAKEPRTGSHEGKEEAATDEPPTKRPRRTASAANQRAAENGKAKGGRPQARRGVVESDSDDNSNIDIEDIEESAPMSENGKDAAARGSDDRPQAQASKKRSRVNKEAPARKGRPKPAPASASAKGPCSAAAAKASKTAPSGAAAKSGKGSMDAPPAVKEKRPGSGKQDSSEPAAKSAPGDPKQAAEFHMGVLDSAMKHFHEARATFEEAQAVLSQATGQVESTLDNIGELSGLTMEILRDTNVGKAVSSLNKLARLHPGITACDHIASKASEVTQLMKKKIGYATAAPGQQPQGPSQQPKKAALKPEPKPTPPPSPPLAAADAAAATTSAAAATSLPAAPSVKPVQGVSHDTGKPEAAAPRQQAVGIAPSPAVPQAPASSASHQASHVKMEAASRSASPGAQGQDRRKAPAAAGAVPGSAPQASARQHVDSAPEQPDTGPTAQSRQSQGSFEGLVAQSLGDAVRDKAVAILALALTSPSELTPQEAAVAVEAAVFAHFAEEGKPASRYKRRLHALWSYLRGTDHSEVVPKLRQKVLQGEIMPKALAKITRPQAQHLCHLKSTPGSQPKHQTQPLALQPQPVSHPLQQQQQPQQQPQQQSRQHQALQELQSRAQLAQQLPQQLPQQVPQQVPHQLPQPHQQQPVSQSQSLPAVQQQQQPQSHQHPQYYQAAAAAAPYSAPGAYSYDPALYHQPWHNPLPHPHHQQPGGVPVAPPGATLPPFDVLTAIPAPPLHPADTLALSQLPSSSLPWSEAPAPPDEAPPVGVPSAPTRETPSSSSAQPAAASAAASAGLNHAGVHMVVPTPTDATTATPAAAPQATHSAPTHDPPPTETQAEATAGDQHMAQSVTVGMPASSRPGADAAALSSQTPSEPAQEREVPQEPVIARSTSVAMDTS